MSRHLDPTWPERHRRELARWIADRGSRWSESQARVMADAAAVLAAPNGGIVGLFGPRGGGKTLMAAALAHNARTLRESSAVRPGGAQAGVGAARYWVLADLFASEKRSWQAGRTGWERTPAFGAAGSPLDDAHSVDLLVLDEFQERGETDWEDRELTRLIDARYRGCRSTILAGNLTPQEASARLGASIKSRLTEGGALIACSWESHRGKAVAT